MSRLLFSALLAALPVAGAAQSLFDDPARPAGPVCFALCCIVEGRLICPEPPPEPLPAAPWTMADPTRGLEESPAMQALRAALGAREE